ncbi:hypothetical protein IIV31_011L [Armadillidium vulgare iridescent virus]|uniref:Uncharacterized protein n=1 Tax=Armadillidium vulgare iridescent virus TaxID=72201 RepID=A0A068QKM6_9VIRU|nr:hypothetical protein IIV31_011L [Armadillidium vulgare iridescent virus]CCV02383.1 hypothetical protein IIV31_011L [Armadillidium vulgare iridescent virus]
MFQQIILVVLIILLTLFIYKVATANPPLTPLQRVIQRKEAVLNLLAQYGVKLNVAFPPLTCQTIDKHYEIEDMEGLKQSDPEKLKMLISCGFVHDLYLITLLEGWINNSATHSEISFGNYQYLCIRPPSDISTVDFLSVKNNILNCIKTNNL